MSLITTQRPDAGTVPPRTEPVVAARAAAALDVAPAARPPRATARPVSREPFLDAVRGIAVVRVVLWHTFAGVVLSWTVASMPAMFFVAGSLLAQSLSRRPFRQLVRARLQRLLVPFWAFGAVVLSVLAIVHRIDGTASTAIAPNRLLGWLVPIVDPRGSDWESGWVSTPLWYLRCYLWLLLAAPILLRIHRRLRSTAIVLAAVGVFAVDWVVRHQQQVPAELFAIRWYLGDAVTYALFLMLGFAHRDGAFDRVPQRARIEWAGLSLAAALVWIAWVRPASLVVNDSYPLLLFVGCAWLFVFLAAERWIGSLTRRAVIGPVLAWLGRRSMTVYLWHPPAIVGAYWVRARYLPGSPTWAVLPLVALGTIGLCVVFGWIEDRSAGRRAEWWPGHRLAISGGSGSGGRATWTATGLVVGLALGIVVVSIGLPVAGTAPASATAELQGTSSSEAEPGGGLALPPAPSAKPEAADFGAEPAPAVAPVDLAPTMPAAAASTVPGDAGEAQVLAAVDAWRAQQVVDGVVLSVALPGAEPITVVSGQAADQSPLEPAQPRPVTSVTKTMTAALILQLVDDGLIGLDDPLPVLDAVPDFPFAGQVTVRQLLQHTSGVPNYSDTAAWAPVAGQAITPVEALQLAASEPLTWEPGTAQGYSSTGYLTLGLLAEQLTGQPYDELLQQRFFDPFGMVGASVDTTETAGWVGFSAGGVVATSLDLARWGTALLVDRSVLSEASLAEMINVDNEFASGLGLNPVCPCSTTQAGERVYTSIGHHGGEASIQYSPSDGVAIGLQLTESLWTSELNQSDVAELLASVRAALATA